MPSDDHLRRLVSESGPEFFTSQLALARPDIVSVIPQPERIPFIDKRGKKCHHTFDVLLEHFDGTKTAIAVKPFDRVINSDFRETLSVIAGQMPPSFADRACLVTDRSFTRVNHCDCVDGNEFGMFLQCVGHHATSKIEMRSDMAKKRARLSNR
jgi:hypothetical protein